MAKEDVTATLTIAATAIGLYLGGSGVSEAQAVDIAEAVLDDADADQLTLQDLVIFLKGAVAGKYGAFTRNIPTPMDFMKMFEIYRQDRHENLMNLREEQHAQLKGQGPTFRESENKDDVKHIHQTTVLKFFEKQ